MSDPEKHLLRGADRQNQRDLSGATGLSRLSLSERVLSAGERLALGAGREQFCYVLSGGGELSATRQQAGADGAETANASLNAGDFVALAADEEAVIRAESSALTLLIGQGPITPAR